MGFEMNDATAVIDSYECGPAVLRASLEPVDHSQYDVRPIPGRWSIREVVCHLADAEIIYADRMKRVLAETNPTFFDADPDQFRQALSDKNRSVDAELSVVESVRRHMLPILRAVDEDGLHRTGVHSLDGPMTLHTLLQRITNHIPHHVRFIEEKIAALTR